MSLNSIEEIIEDIRQGKMVILMDDEGRENEGDLIMAADRVRAEDISFMARHACGLICLTLTQQRCEQLNLPLMVQDNKTKNGTAFTLSIEATTGVTTGISAADRARTVQAAVARNATAADIVQPGHIFPLMADPAGVLNRAGHTEAGCDLARLAGYEPSAVIVEIMNPDGTMARRDDLEKFAQEHDLKMGTVEDLIHYRLSNDHTVNRLSEKQITTQYGDFQLTAFEDEVQDATHLALTKGDISPDEPTLVRVCTIEGVRDILGIESSGLDIWSIGEALARMEQEGKGALILLDLPQNNRDLLRSATILEPGFVPDPKPASAPAGSGFTVIGTGCQMLRDLGVGKMRLMHSEIRYPGMAGFGLETVEFIPGPKS